MANRERDEAKNEAGYGSIPNPPARSFGVLVERAFKSIWHSKNVMFIQIAAYVVISLVIGIGNYDMGNDALKVVKNINCIFCSILFIVLIGSMPTILTLPRTSADFVRENHRNKHSMLAFYLARILIDLPFHFLFSSAYAVVIYTLTSQPMDKPHVHVFAFLPICVLTSFVSYSLGLLIAVELSGKTNTMHGIVSLAIVVPVVLLTGFILDFNLLSNYFKWLTWISYVRYAFDGALISIYGFGREKLNCSIFYCHFRYPPLVLVEYSIREENHAYSVVALVWVFAAFQIFALLLLLWKIRSKK